jgi:hypothetical protein
MEGQEKAHSSPPPVRPPAARNTNANRGFCSRAEAGQGSEGGIDQSMWPGSQRSLLRSACPALSDRFCQWGTAGILSEKDGCATKVMVFSQPGAEGW